MNPYVPCEGLVLAGGQSTRMQGQNKALISVNDKPMLNHALDQLKPHCQRIHIAAGQHMKAYEPLLCGENILQDNGTEGPLAGLSHGLRALTNNDWLICSPCDTPFAGSDWPTALLSAQMTYNQPKAFYIFHDGRPHYAHSLWHKSVISLVDNSLSNGPSSIKACLHAAHAMEVRLPKGFQGNFNNLNTPSDVELLSDDWPPASR